MAGSGAAPRLELVWPNKEQFLLSPKDATGKPIWVSRNHPAASEVRVVDWTSCFGQVGEESDRVQSNLLFTGDSVDVLRILAEHPDFRREYRGKVKCVYIDPPFNTGQTFDHYDDWLEHSTWLSFMRERLLLIKDLLSAQGSVWIHLDDAEQHRMRCLLDEIFGAGNFVATLVWQKRYSRDNRPAIGAVHDYVMIYAPSGSEWKHHRNRLVRTGAKEYRNPTGDPRGLWRVVPMTAQGFRPNQMYAITSPGGTVHVPPKGRCWGMVRDTFEQRLAEGRVYFGIDGRAQPGIIRYLDEDEGLVPWTWWPHDEVGHTDEAKKEMLALFPEREAFATPKPERLIERVVSIASNPGDVVLDVFAGSGTTAAVAHKLRRRWVTAELSPSTVEAFTRPRLQRVVAGNDPGGITDAAGWQGGEGFREVSVAPSMYDVTSNGIPLLADWVTNGRFARAVAAQLDFDFDADGLPFCGRRGRMQLAVLDGAVGPEEIRTLIAALDEHDRVTVVAKVVLPGAEQTLASLSNGSRIRKAPRDLLADGNHRSQRRASILR